MKIKLIASKIKGYLKELTIITAGVLIALLISNYKENSQARTYYRASVETVKNEVQSNFSNLKSIIETQNVLIDSIKKYSADTITISDLIIEKGGGIQGIALSNSGLEFYKKNQINAIDFKMMSRLIEIESTSKLIETKMDKLMDYLYPNLFVASEESKKLIVLHLKNLLNSELKLEQLYKEFITEYDLEKNSPNN
ncbi:hypothetical protein [Cellulophaga baltica]|uniref:Uncharacterized protein n=1 Tax=Cellulophaga baltica TaxID=76594 RepID=A0A1G7K974_9FLAO|nr:hypothetical protein [Cellulophaga baltica]SDF33868.1 hypothetical protein SAMN04487992_1126 [Cellulophaga baltica]